MEDLKKKLSEGKLTRVELNAAQPHDKNTLEWKAWNDLRIAMNDRTANLTEVHGMRLTAAEKMLLKHVTRADEKFAELEMGAQTNKDAIATSITAIADLTTKIDKLTTLQNETIDNLVARRKFIDTELAEQKRMNTIAFEKILEAIDHVANNHIHTVEGLARAILEKLEEMK